MSAKLAISPLITRLVARLAKISKFSEQQVLEDLCIGGVEETTELYEQIRAFRKGGETKPDAIPRSESPKPVEEENVPRGTIGSDAFAAGPVGDVDHGQIQTEPDLGEVERALAMLGDAPERSGQLAASQTHPGNSGSPSDDDDDLR